MRAKGYKRVVADNLGVPLFTSLDESRLRTVINHEGEPRYIHDYFGTSAEVGEGPQGFLVEMPPDNVGQAHFHGTDQFQVFFAQDGAMYQRHPFAPVTVHYSDAYTTYGPFTSGNKGPLQFFTLRAKGSTITAYMPGARDQLVGHPGRNVEVDADPVDQRLDAPGETSTRPLIGPDADGMAAFLVQGGPGSSVRGPSAAGSSGQYYCVVRGELLVDGKPYGVQSLQWIDPDEEAPLLSAGPDSAFAVLVMQYPLPGERVQGP